MNTGGGMANKFYLNGVGYKDIKAVLPNRAIISQFYLNGVGYKDICSNFEFQRCSPFYLNGVGYKGYILSRRLCMCMSVLSERSGI